jgi:hypothetical protein
MDEHNQNNYGKDIIYKSIIDANKTVREFLEQDFGMSYDDKFFTEEWWDVESQRTERAHFIVVGEYADGTEADVKFYRSVKRGDKRISIQKLKQYAEAGDSSDKKPMPQDDPCDDWSDRQIPKSGDDRPKCTD